MGAKNSKVKKGEKKGAAAGDESSDQVDKTATLPASFKKKVKTLPYHVRGNYDLPLKAYKERTETQYILRPERSNCKV